MEQTIILYHDIIQYFKLNYINLVSIPLFLVVGFIIANFIKRRVMSRLVKKSPNLIKGSFIAQIISFTLKTIVVLATPYLLCFRSFTNKILTDAVLLTFVIGFALKDIGENFLAGNILTFKSPFRLDDLIKVIDIDGVLKDISLRKTLIKTPDGKDVFFPNTIIFKKTLFNYTLDGLWRYEFMIGIAYKNNPTEAVKITLETANNVEGVLKGSRNPNISINEPVINAINIWVMFWVDTFKHTSRIVHLNTRSQVMNDFVAALITNGFSLPTSIIELKTMNHQLRCT